MNKYTQTVPIEISGGEVVATVSYAYTKGSPAVMYQRNGDPGWPAEPAEADILTVKVDGQDVPAWFEKAAFDHIYEWLLDHHTEPEREYERDDGQPSELEEWRDFDAHC